MTLRKEDIVRIAIGLVLVVVAGCISFVIRDLLASQNPVSALPILSVEYSGAEVPPQHTAMDAYEWRFVNKTVKWHLEDREAWKTIEPFQMKPGVPFEIQFSFSNRSMRVSRAYGDEDNFEVQEGDLVTPYTGGVYTYRIVAEWGPRGSVAYYLRIEI